MSSLLIEGGHRLEGRVSVEGNKNAALPLLAACLLTDQECVLTNVPRIGDVDVMARLLLDVGAEVEGIGTTTLRSGRRRFARTSQIVPWSAGCAGPSFCWSAARADRAGATSPRPAATFQRVARLRRISRRCCAMGAHDDGGPDHALQAPDGLKPASMYLEEASVTGTETVLLAAASAVGAVPKSGTQRPSRTWWNCVSSW